MYTKYNISKFITLDFSLHLNIFSLSIILKPLFKAFQSLFALKVNLSRPQDFVIVGKCRSPRWRVFTCDNKSFVH